MSENTDSDETEYDGTETDWLANSVDGYGFGYTREQALAAWSRNASPTRDSYQVQLIEHVGDAKMGPGGARVETLVESVAVEIPADEAIALRDAAIEANHAATAAIEASERIDDD